MVGNVYHLVKQNVKELNYKKDNVTGSVKEVQYQLKRKPKRTEKVEDRKLSKKRYKYFPEWKMWLSGLQRGPLST